MAFAGDDRHAGRMTSVSLPGHADGQRWRAAVFMLVAVGLFALMDAGLKSLSVRYPPMQVSAMRGMASLPFVLVWALVSLGPRRALPALLRVRWPLHALRAVLGITMMAAFVYALRTLPLSTAYTIFFVAPLLITALSVPFLGERVGPRRWTAILVGFVGVLVVLRPTGDGIASLAGLAVLMAAFGYAVSAITVRVLSRTDSSQAIVVWMLTSLALGAGALALPNWVTVRSQDFALILGVGVAGALGQYTITEAFRRGEASLIAPLEYSALLWGVLLDFSLWQVLPDGMTWVGAAIIVLSGLYLLRRERLQAGADSPP